MRLHTTSLNNNRHLFFIGTFLIILSGLCLVKDADGFLPIVNSNTLSSVTTTTTIEPLLSTSPVVASLSVGMNRGGAKSSSSRLSAISRRDTTPSNDCPFRKTCHFAASVWGTGGLVYILIRSIKKIAPIALEPFAVGKGGASNAVLTPPPLTRWQLGVYIATCLWFAYVEGYKGFQRKYSPLVVSRSFTVIPLRPETNDNSNVPKRGSIPHTLHTIFAPLYCMGLFYATRKRMITSWSVTLGVALLVAGVKRLPYPWRNIIDAGVVVGLTWGCTSIVWQYLWAIFGEKKLADPALPTVNRDIGVKNDDNNSADIIGGDGFVIVKKSP